jgi:hypothetical protein
MEDSFNNGNKNNIIYNTEFFFMYIKKMIEKAQRKKERQQLRQKNILKFLRIK